MNQSLNRNRADQTKGQQAGTLMRGDIALISPQGKASSLLANLMNQKELVQSSKESLITRILDEEDGGSPAGLQEQLEEYEKQLDKINEQIAAEMAKQAEGTKEQGGTGQKPEQNQGMDVSAVDGETITELTKLSADLETPQTADQARVRREGEKRVCEAEMKLGSDAAERKLKKINQTEEMTEKFSAVRFQAFASWMPLNAAPSILYNPLAFH